MAFDIKNFDAREFTRKGLARHFAANLGLTAGFGLPSAVNVAAHTPVINNTAHYATSVVSTTSGLGNDLKALSNGANDVYVAGKQVAQNLVKRAPEIGSTLVQNRANFDTALLVAGQRTAKSFSQSPTAQSLWNGAKTLDQGAKSLLKSGADTSSKVVKQGAKGLSQLGSDIAQSFTKGFSSINWNSLIKTIVR